MATKPTVKPRWATDDVFDPGSGTDNVAEPSEPKKDRGWDDAEIPPRQWWNWLHRIIYRWVDWLDGTTIPLNSDVGTSNEQKTDGTGHTHALNGASQAEAEAGTDNEKVMTPLRTAQARKPLEDRSDALTKSFLRNWSLQTAASVASWEGVAWSGDVGLFVAVAPGTSAMTSPNGIDWTSRTVPSGQWESVTYGSSAGVFVAVAETGTNRIMTSPDGITWTPRTGTGSANYNDVEWSEDLGLFVAVDEGTTDAVDTSPDGITWTNRTTPEVGLNYSGIAWAPSIGLFAIASHNGVITSPDGITWTEQTVPAGNWSNIAWSEKLGLFAVISINGEVMTSPDGVTWTEQTSPITSSLEGIAWGESIGGFVAVGASDGLYSTDGVLWISTPHPESDWLDVTWSEELGMFVAVSFNGTEQVMATI